MQFSTTKVVVESGVALLKTTSDYCIRLAIAGSSKTNGSRISDRFKARMRPDQIQRVVFVVDAYLVSEQTNRRELKVSYSLNPKNAYPGFLFFFFFFASIVVLRRHYRTPRRLANKDRKRGNIPFVMIE